MDELGVTDVADRLIRHLLKGYRQSRFCTGSDRKSRTLILDEPTVGLDPKQIIEIRELIKSLGRKHTVILSSHILSEVSEICDTVLIISKGKLVACDTPENLAKGQSETASVTVTSPDSKTEVLRRFLLWRRLKTFQSALTIRSWYMRSLRFREMKTRAVRLCRP